MEAFSHKNLIFISIRLIGEFSHTTFYFLPIHFYLNRSTSVVTIQRKISWLSTSQLVGCHIPCRQQPQQSPVWSPTPQSSLMAEPLPRRIVPYRGRPGTDRLRLPRSRSGLSRYSSTRGALVCLSRLPPCKYSQVRKQNLTSFCC